MSGSGQDWRRCVLTAARQKGQRLAERFGSLAIDRRGTIAMVFGLAMIPFAVATATAIDYARAYLVQQRMLHSLDAAALALAASSHRDADDLTQVARSFFEANYPDDGSSTIGEISVTVDESTVTLSVSASVDTALLQVVGIEAVSVAATTEVLKETKGAEIVLVLDNTGSMGNGGKLSALKQATTDLVNIVFGNQEEPELLKMGLVPFSAGVNVGADKVNSGWIDVDARSSYHGLNFAGGANVFSMYAMLSNKSWNGCVEARPHPLDVLDTPPDPTNGDTLWVPYFAPDEPDDYPANRAGYSRYWNNYLDDGVNNNNLDMDYRQRRKEKYNGRYVSGAGPHDSCNIAPLTPLTNVKADLLDAVDKMVANGSTVIPSGLAWGWRVLSPTPPFTEGVAYDDEEYRKVLVLLTDGMNDIGSNRGPLNSHNKSFYSGYGYVSQGRLGTTNVSAAHQELDARTATLCENIKATGITVYTITFQLADGPIKDLMRDCASGPEKYFDSPDNATLRMHFNAIGKELRKLRISK